jgi:predicted ATPase
MTSTDTPVVVLPADLTRFVGRRADLAALADALTWARLVTLTGVGGMGKTRLAVQAARDTAAHADRSHTALAGTYFVDLGSLPQDSDADDVRAHIAETIGIRLSHLTEDTFLDQMRDRALLLVLDNCETVLEASSACITAMLAATADLRVIATQERQRDRDSGQ